MTTSRYSAPLRPGHRLLGLVIAGLLTFLPTLTSAAEPLGFTVQTGSYPNRESALKNYNLLAEQLPANLKNNLRVEFIKPYYTVRLGQAAKADEVAPALAAAKKIAPQATVIKAYLLKDRIIQPAQSPTAASNPAAPPSKENESSPTPKEKTSSATVPTEKESGKEKISIPFGNSQEDSRYIVSGFFPGEQNTKNSTETFRWSSDKGLLQLPASGKITFHLRNWRPPQAGAPLLTITINEQTVPLQTETNPNEEVVTVTVPAALRKKKAPLQVAIRCRTFSMKQLGLSDDSRVLGVAISRIDLE